MTHISIIISAPTLSDIDDKVGTWVGNALRSCAPVTACRVEVVQYPDNVSVSVLVTHVVRSKPQDVVARGQGITVETALEQAFRDLAARLRSKKLRTTTLRMPATA